MAVRLNRRAALVALFSAMRAQHRGGHSLGQRLLALPRMIFQTLIGRYDGKWRLLLMAAATAYVVSPVDLIPEAIFLVAGLVDDAVVLAWLAGAVLSETERFLEWEAITAAGRGRRAAFAPGDFASGDFAPGDSAPGGFAPGGFAPGGFAPGGGRLTSTAVGPNAS